MSKPLILTYDVGTQSTRAILVDKEGNIVDKEQVKYADPYFRRRPGWAEQKTDFYFEHMCTASRALMARNADKAGDIIACAITVITAHNFISITEHLFNLLRCSCCT